MLLKFLEPTPILHNQYNMVTSKCSICIYMLYELENIAIQRFSLLVVAKGMTSNLNEYLCNINLT